MRNKEVGTGRAPRLRTLRRGLWELPRSQSDEYMRSGAPHHESQ